MLLLLIVLGSLLSLAFFFGYWEINSSNINSQVEPSYEFSNETLVTTYKQTITIDNYVPWLTKAVTFDMNKYTYEPGNEILKKESVDELAAENITIEQQTCEVTYGDNTVGTPQTYSNPPKLTGTYIPRMSRSTTTINWSQKTENYSVSRPSYSISLSLRTRSGPSFELMFRPLLDIVPYNYESLFVGILFCLACTFTGFVSAVYVLRNTPNLREDYKFLMTFDSKKPESDANVAELGKKLNTLKLKLNLFGSISRLFLGLSFLIFKMRVAGWCKYHSDKCTLEGNDKFGKKFSENVESSESKVSDLIPEKQTILVLIGVLTSVGVSFSFNVGAIAPLLLSIGIFYVFLNIGSTFYLNGMLKEIALPIVLLGISVLAVSSPAIFEILRNMH